MNPFTVVVPLIPQHDSKIKKLFKTLSCETQLISEVILCRSETFMPHWILERKFNLLAKHCGLKVPVIVDSIRGVARDGTNRNRGWKIAKAPYVAFMDADDSYTTNRLEILHNVFLKFDPDAVIHDYRSSDGDAVFDVGVNLDDIKVSACRLAEFKKEGEEFFSVCDVEGNPLQIHFAHLTVKTDLRGSIQFSNRFPAADAQMTQDLLVLKKSVQYVASKLSGWERDRSIRYKVRLLRGRLSKHFSS
jgi:hypothetical protein